MSAGKLRERVVFQRLDTEATDDYGQPHDAWEALFTRWGDLIETPGRERLKAGALHSEVTATLRIRKSTTADTITTADRVVMRGDNWDIESITQVTAKGKRLEMLIRRGVTPE
jgi:SPP1 family predicted phage head-tail adaptor